jgi:hypothetical protein
MSRVFYLRLAQDCGLLIFCGAAGWLLGRWIAMNVLPNLDPITELLRIR